MECHSAMRKKESLPFVSTGVDLEGIMLNEIIQIMLNTVYCHMWNLEKTERVETE